MLTNKKLVTSCSALTLTTLGLLLFNGCAPAGPSAVLGGARLLREGRPEQAVQRLQEGVRLLPKNAQAWNYLGVAYHRAGRPADALKAYHQALALDRNLWAARFNLGCLYLEQSNPNGAIAELTTFTVLRPNSPAGWSRLGTAQLRARQLDNAERSFTQSLKLDPTAPDSLNGLGLVMAQRRRYPEALSHFNAALKSKSDHAPALLNAAIVSLQNLNDRPVALQKFRDYLALKPSPPNATAVRELVDSLDPATPRVVATHPSTNVVQTTTPPTQRVETAAALARSQPTPSTNKPSLAPPPQPAPVPTTSAVLVAQLNPAATSVIPARVTSTNSSTTNPQLTANAPPTKSIDVVQVASEEPIRPIRDVPPPSTRTIATDANNAKPSSTAAPPVEAASAKAASDSVSQTPTQSKPNQKQSFIKKLNPVNWFRSKDGGEKSTPRAQDGGTVAKNPNVKTEPLVASSAGAATPATNSTLSFSGSRYAYHSFEAPAPGDRAQAERFVSDGVKARDRNRLTDSLDAFRKAAAADPSFFEAHYNLGVAAFEAGDYPKALLAYEQALAINPDSMKARYNFAVALEQANYQQDAASELERVIVQNPTEAAPHLALANLYARQPRGIDKARREYLRLLELQPQNPQATAIRYWLEAHPQ